MYKDLLGESGVMAALEKFENKIFEMFRDDPLDEDNVKQITDMIKLRMNYRHGNLTSEEYAQGLTNLDRSPDNYAATLTSEWDDGSVIVSDAVYNSITGEITAELSGSKPGKNAMCDSQELSVVIRGVQCTFTVCPECSAAVCHEDDQGNTVCTVCVRGWL